MEGKLSTSILIQNHLGIPLFSRVISRLGNFSVVYGELPSIIEGYITGCSIPDLLVVENDSLKAINNLNSRGEDLCALEILTTYFLENISLISTSFLHIVSRKYLGSSSSKNCF